jgi:hypothetical protein
MSKQELEATIRAIGLALNASHNAVATDECGIEPNEASWRINHSTELQMLKELEQHLMANSDTDL